MVGNSTRNKLSALKGIRLMRIRIMPPEHLSISRPKGRKRLSGKGFERESLGETHPRKVQWVVSRRTSRSPSLRAFAGILSDLRAAKTFNREVRKESPQRAQREPCF